MPDDERDDDDSPPESPAPVPVSDAWRDFLGLPLILRVVMKRVFHHAPENLVDELVSDANYACLIGPLDQALPPPDIPQKLKPVP